MKPEELNPKAREAFAKILIDVRVSIFKTIILLVTVAPISIIFKSVFDGKALNISLLKMASSISSGTQFSFWYCFQDLLYSGNSSEKKVRAICMRSKTKRRKINSHVGWKGIMPSSNEYK